MQLQQIRRVWTFANINGMVPGTSSGDRWIKHFNDIGFTDLVVAVNDFSMINDSFQMFSAAQKLDTFKTLRAAIGKSDLHIMVWIRPDSHIIQQCGEKILPICKAIGVRSVLFDAEEPWTKGWRNLDSHQRESVEKTFIDTFRSAPCCLGVTHICSSSIMDEVKMLSDLCQYSLPQAYSSMKVDVGTTFKAPKLQQLGADLCKPSRNTIVMGLASYDLEKEQQKRSVKEMQKDIEATDSLDHVINEVAYWRLSGFFQGDASGKVNLGKEVCKAARAGGPSLLPLCAAPGILA